VFVHNIVITTIGDLPLVRETGHKKGIYLFIKPYLDFILAALLIILLSPAFLLIMLLIRLNSEGPAIFKHERVGKDGRIFQVYKFRTMYKETPPSAPSPVSHDDPRITKVGRFLRKTSLDELPQLINILKGEMSFVGPRPEMPFIVETYNELQRKRLKMTPGITGMWQLSGDRRKAIHENMDYDLYYIRHVSFFLDVAILIETLIFAFRGI
jgi:lipopolysaccharide/colanic/teichoic acid biosynthesis glycosyltransferase